MDRTPIRRGMVTSAVVAAFRSIGWSWGGSWTGDTKDYMASAGVIGAPDISTWSEASREMY